MTDKPKSGITILKVSLYSLALCILVFFDQVTKWFVFEKMLRIKEASPDFITWLQTQTSMEETLSSLANFQMIEVTPFLHLVAIWNSGVSFGLLNNNSMIMSLILTGFALLMSLVMIVWGMRSPKRIEQMATLLIAAGALSNAFDRFRFKAVADFVYFNYNGYYWPAFNAADAYITLGAGILIVYILFTDAYKE
jgi:signal peptidase II